MSVKFSAGNWVREVLVLICLFRMFPFVGWLNLGCDGGAECAGGFCAERLGEGNRGCMLYAVADCGEAQAWREAEVRLERGGVRSCVAVFRIFVSGFMFPRVRIVVC